MHYKSKLSLWKINAINFHDSLLLDVLLPKHFLQFHGKWYYRYGPSQSDLALSSLQ